MLMDKKLINEKIDLVSEKLVHLGACDYDLDKDLSREEILKYGKCSRDFGIEEWDWPQGVGLYGLYLLYEKRKDWKLLDFFTKWYENNLERGLPSQNINTTCPYLTLVELLDIIPHRKIYEDLCIGQANFLMDKLPRTKDGGFQHVTSDLKDRNKVMLNEGQLWADTLFMAVLFLQKMGLRYQNKEWLDEATRQYLTHIKYLFNKSTGLLYHGFSFIRNDNFAGAFWCRGNSWFTLGLSLFLENAKAIDGGTFQYLADTFKSHVNALKDCQRPSGLFSTLLDDKSTYEEVSGSSAMAAGILKGIKLGILDSSYKEFADKIISAICSNIDKDGTVLNVSAGTAMGMEKDFYKNIPLSPMAYGQALALIALCQLI